MILPSFIIPADTLGSEPHGRFAGKGARMPFDEQDIELLAGIVRREEDSLRELYRWSGESGGSVAVAPRRN
jgi:hypothetical protein